MDFSEEAASGVVNESIAAGTDPRLAQLIGGLVDHLHAYVREVRPTVDEWSTAIDFLTRVGHKCDPTRQEFVLLSDVLGVSMLVETINGQKSGTESTVLGPFHMVTGPPRSCGDSIDLLTGGRDWFVEFRVVYEYGAPSGRPFPTCSKTLKVGSDLRIWFYPFLVGSHPRPTSHVPGVDLQRPTFHACAPAHAHAG